MLHIIEQKIFCMKTSYDTNSFKILQATYRRKLHFNTFPSRSQNFKLVKNFEANATFRDRRATSFLLYEFPITIRGAIRNVYACHIQQHPQLNGEYLENVL